MVCGEGKLAIRLIHAEHSCAQPCQWKGKSAPTAGSVENPAPGAEVQHRPQIQRLLLACLVRDYLRPYPEVILVEEGFPPLIHDIASFPAQALRGMTLENYRPVEPGSN
jgi:hypothetical protein